MSAWKKLWPEHCYALIIPEYSIIGRGVEQAASGILSALKWCTSSLFLSTAGPILTTAQANSTTGFQVWSYNNLAFPTRRVIGKLTQLNLKSGERTYGNNTFTNIGKTKDYAEHRVAPLTVLCMWVIPTIGSVPPWRRKFARTLPQAANNCPHTMGNRNRAQIFEGLLLKIFLPYLKNKTSIILFFHIETIKSISSTLKHSSFPQETPLTASLHGCTVVVCVFM